MSKNRPRKGDARHVRLYAYMTRTPAWKSLNSNERATYLLLAERYMGLNNGKIPYSVREVVAELHISQPTAWRCLAALQERGFIVARVKGAFSLKRRHATEWRLTEHPCNVSGHGPSGEYREWRPEPKIQNTGFVVKPDGFRGETVVAKMSRNGFRGETVRAKKSISRVSPRNTLSYQVGAVADLAVNPASAPPDGPESARRRQAGQARQPSRRKPRPRPAGGKLPWSTPTLTEVTDPVEARLIRRACPPPK